jgi:hypothetical protein
VADTFLAHLQTLIEGIMKQQRKILGELSVGSRVSASDTAFFYDFPVIVDVEPGEYVVEAVCAEGQRVVSASAVRKATTGAKRGRARGSIAVEFGQVGICDRDTFDHALKALNDPMLDGYFSQLNVDTPGVARVNGATMVFFRPLPGDGEFYVYELIDSEGRCCGIEIDCTSLADWREFQPS